MSKEKILIADGDANIRQTLKKRLGFLGYEIFLASNSIETLRTVKTEPLQLVILDIILPNADGYEVCREIKKSYNIPLIIITSLYSISNRVKGFEFGADDYLIKPFFPIELETRIRSLLRRVNSGSKSYRPPTKSPNIIQVGLLIINLTERQVFKKKIRIHLTDIEFKLLELLIDNRGVPLSRSTILNNVWGYTPARDVDTRVVDVHIARLRSKVEADSRKPDFILTARRIGYFFSKY